ncbi:terminase small subunit [Variovorax paradoxus]|uniref:terminase small subunit n=1 Tax=Variovorax paradoxus TaxID=34073 RepID=UPI001931F1BA|nr:terminase small subunit [Variovorax paradoxus]
MATKKLTLGEARFVAELLTDPKRNRTQALIRAGYSEKGARQSAHRLMQSPAVIAAIDAATARMTEKLNLKAEAVLQNIHRIGMKAEFSNDYNAALRSQELLGKHLKLFTEKHEHGGLDGGPIQFVMSEKEADL